MWKSLAETEIFTRSCPRPDCLERSFALSLFWKNAVYSRDYVTDKRWSELLVLSDAGSGYLQDLGDAAAKSIDGAALFQALFMTFFHHDIAFDWVASDLKSITDLLDAEVRDKKIYLPHRFGRLLYDRFNDLYKGNRTRDLPASDTATLLDGTPQGVYQVGTLVSGPLGLIHSQASRFVPPTRRLPLWHCSDTGCRALHDVTLVSPSVPVLKALDLMQLMLSRKLGRPSEWTPNLLKLHRRGNWEKGHPYFDLAALLGDSVVGVDRALLVEAALRGPNAQLLRDVLAARHIRKVARSSSPDELASRLSAEEQLQLLLVLPDAQIVDLVDHLVDSEEMKLAPGEIRRTIKTPTSLPNDTPSEIGALGLRTVGHNPVVSLCDAIWRGYQNADITDELAWKLRSLPGNSILDNLVAYVRTRGPGDALSHLVLTSHDVTSFICQQLGLCIEGANQEEAKIASRLLWKLGFNPPVFDDFIQRFESRLNSFRETTMSVTPARTEDEREQIRSIGVNLFVSVEDFLDRLIVYNVWLVAADHFLSTGFSFDLSRARSEVARARAVRLRARRLKVVWNTHGENPLGTLLRYLHESVRWMEGLPERDKDSVLRPKTDLPFFAEDTRRRFPFEHTELWADCETDELRRYIGGYKQIVRLLAQADLAAVRNGLDHHRDSLQFPSCDAMLACATRVSEALALADLHRYIPKVFWLQKMTRDRFGLTEYEFRDYRGRIFTLFGPRMVAGLPSLDYSAPVLISPANLLGLPNAQLAFTLAQSTEYSRYWDGYPRRRQIPHVVAAQESAEASAG